MQIAKVELYRQLSRELCNVGMLEVVESQRFHREWRFHIF